jgi:Mor family transcriptional regulator
VDIVREAVAAFAQAWRDNPDDKIKRDAALRRIEFELRELWGGRRFYIRHTPPASPDAPESPRGDAKPRSGA